MLLLLIDVFLHAEVLSQTQEQIFSYLSNTLVRSVFELGNTQSQKLRLRNRYKIKYLSYDKLQYFF